MFNLKNISLSVINAKRIATITFGFEQKLYLSLPHLDKNGNV